MSQGVCGIDRRPTPDDQPLCDTCWRRLREWLASVPALVADLEITLARQHSFGAQYGVRRSSERPVVFHVPASDVLYTLRHLLARWAGAPMATSPVEAARRLLERPDDLLRHPDLIRRYEALSEVMSRAYGVIDKPAELRYFGVCRVCGRSLRAPLHTVTIKCTHCSQRYDAQELRELRVRASHWLLATADTIAQVLPDLINEQRTARTIHAWYARGRLFRRGRNAQGAALYRVGDVITLVRTTHT